MRCFQTLYLGNIARFLTSILGGIRFRQSVVIPDTMRQAILRLICTISLAGCAATPNVAPAASLDRSGELNTFALHVLNDDFQTLGLGYTLEKAWPILKQAYPSSTRTKLVLGDVETFDWVSQTMTLTLSASNAFKASFNIHNRIEVAGTFGIPHRAFVVVVNGIPQYGGVFLERGSQMAVEYPVIYIDEDDDGKVVLTIRPIHMVGDALIKLSESNPLWKTIKQEQIRNIIGKAGKLIP